MNDYIYFLNGTITGLDYHMDRFCGATFPKNGTAQVCCKFLIFGIIKIVFLIQISVFIIASILPFRLTLITDDQELANEENNQGFCLNFQ